MDQRNPIPEVDVVLLASQDRSRKVRNYGEFNLACLTRSFAKDLLVSRA